MSTELAWAAGFFDGEGCTCARKLGNLRYPYMNIQQSDPYVLQRFRDAVGIGKVYGPSMSKNNTLSQKPYWQFGVGKTSDVSKIIHQLWPYLSPTKQEQAVSVFVKYWDDQETKQRHMIQ